MVINTINATNGRPRPQTDTAKEMRLLRRFAACCLAMLIANYAYAGEAEETAAFREVQTKLAKALPTGWELVVIGKKLPASQREIVIRSTKKLTVEQVYPSSPGLGTSNPPRNPNLKAMVIEIKLATEPLIRPKRFIALKRLNAKHAEQRIAFGIKHFTGMSWRNAKSREPYPPRILKPKTTEQKKRVAEYRALWLRTRPRRLPTHFFKSLSFTRRDEPFISFQEENDRKRFKRISDAIEKTLTKYM